MCALNSIEILWLHHFDLSYTWEIHNSQKKSRIDLAFANQNLVSGVTEMRHIWNQSSLSDHAMISISVDFETIERGKGIFKCSLELHLDVNYQNIIHRTIKQHIIDGQLESKTKQELVDN